MKRRAILGLLVAMLVLPSFAAAQNLGFVPGINPGWVHPVSPAVTGRIVQPFGIVGSHVAITPGQHGVPGPHVIPPHPAVRVPPPRGSRVASGVGATLKHGRVTPGLSVGRTLGRGRFGHPRARAIIPTPPGTFVSFPGVGASHLAGPVVVGMPRADVVLRLGRPRATILSRHDETLVFTGTTVIIQNGVVAHVR